VPVHETQVLFLQNRSGFDKWAPTRDKLDQLKHVWLKR
jgi:hypothetical protein